MEGMVLTVLLVVAEKRKNAPASQKDIDGRQLAKTWRATRHPRRIVDPVRRALTLMLPQDGQMQP